MQDKEYQKEYNMKLKKKHKQEEKIYDIEPRK